MPSDERMRVFEHLAETYTEQTHTSGETTWYVDMRTRQVVRRTVDGRHGRRSSGRTTSINSANMNNEG